MRAATATLWVVAPSRPVRVYVAAPDAAGRTTLLVSVRSEPTTTVRLPWMPGPVRQNRSPTAPPVAVRVAVLPGAVPDEVTVSALAEPRACVRPATAWTVARHHWSRPAPMPPAAALSIAAWS